eukprot:6207114-Pleurochrysis_carterae.AAC.1
MVAIRTSVVSWFSPPSCALIYQCAKDVALKSFKGYAIGSRFRQWIEAELQGKAEKSFDKKLLVSVEDMLAICSSRDYILFIDAAVTKRFSQTGSLRTYLEVEAPRLAGSCAMRSSPALAPRVSWPRCARWPSSASPRCGCR